MGILSESVELHCLSLEALSKKSKMPRGGKRGHKGGRKQFSNPQALEAAKAKEAKEKEWRRARGEDVSDTESEGEDVRKKTVVQMKRLMVSHSERRNLLSQSRSQNQNMK